MRSGVLFDHSVENTLEVAAFVRELLQVGGQSTKAMDQVQAIIKASVGGAKNSKPAAVDPGGTGKTKTAGDGDDNGEEDPELQEEDAAAKEEAAGGGDARAVAGVTGGDHEKEHEEVGGDDAANNGAAGGGEAATLRHPSAGGE